MTTHPSAAVRSGRYLIAVAACGLSLVLGGCAGHEDRVKGALDALDAGAPESAVALLNEEMEVASKDQLPTELEGDNALLLLDRGTILQSIDDYKRSARDLGAADKAIDMLDLSSSAADDIGKYLFSDDVGRYRAPSYEKLMVNTVNMMNYLSLGDLNGARVEARRLAVIQKYFQEHEEEQTALIGLGSYIAGLVFEKSGKTNEALIYYDEALRYAQYRSLRDPLRVLTGGESKSPGMKAVMGDAGPLPSVAETGEAEVVVVIAYGRVPQKIPKRIPIGLALTLTADIISPTDHARANELALKGLVTWVNYPTLGKSRGKYSQPTLVLDGRAVAMEEAMDVEREVRKAWDAKEGVIILSAITRTIARVIAGEVVQGATDAAADAGPLGLLLGLATTATLTAADTPDTRAWSTLPARIAIARFRVPAGQHELQMRARGVTKTMRVNLKPGGWTFAVHSALR